jgi:hypothetical protein
MRSRQGGGRSTSFWLGATAVVLLILNAIALFFYLDPPGGSKRELVEEESQIQREIVAARARAARLRLLSQKVQLGSSESSDFESRYFLPKRLAYEDVIAEIQRMSKVSGLQEREAAFTEEPIEGAPDLELLNVTAAFQGTYENLMRFFYEADRSPILLMIDAVQAAPQQRSMQINTTIRFQAILHDNNGLAGGMP